MIEIPKSIIDFASKTSGMKDNPILTINPPINNKIGTKGFFSKTPVKIETPKPTINNTPKRISTAKAEPIKSIKIILPNIKLNLLFTFLLGILEIRKIFLN